MTAKKWEHTNRDKRQVDKLSGLEFHFKQWGWLGAEAPLLLAGDGAVGSTTSITLIDTATRKMFMKEAQLTCWDKKNGLSMNQLFLSCLGEVATEHTTNAPSLWVQHTLAGASRLPSLHPQWVGSALTAGQRVTSKDLKLLFRTKNYKAPATPAELHSGSWVVWWAAGAAIVSNLKSNLLLLLCLFIYYSFMSVGICALWKYQDYLIIYINDPAQLHFIL